MSYNPFPPANAANGGAVPAQTLLVGGSDGTDIRSLATDTGGQVKVLVENTPAVTLASTTITGSVTVTEASLDATIVTPGAAVPTKLLYVGGTDGTDVRGFSVDASGHLQVIDQNLKNTVQAPASAVPADAVMIGATDGTNTRFIRSDGKGQQFVIPAAPNTATGDRPPNEITAYIAAAVTVTTTVAAAVSGKSYRVYAVKLMAGGTGTTVACEGTSGSTVMTFCQANTFVGFDECTIPLSGLKMDANTALQVHFYGGSGGVNAWFLATLETT